MRDERFVRLFSILGQLSPHSQVTVGDLANEYGVSAKSIQRDVEVLQDAKLGVFVDEKKIKISRIGYRKIAKWIGEEGKEN